MKEVVLVLAAMKFPNCYCVQFLCILKVIKEMLPGVLSFPMYANDMNIKHRQPNSAISKTVFIWYYSTVKVNSVDWKDTWVTILKLCNLSAQSVI